MRGLIPSAILICGLGSRLFLGEGAADIRQLVARVAIVHMARDNAGGCCGADEMVLARTLRRELAHWQVTWRRKQSIRRQHLLSQRERRDCHSSGEREAVELLWRRLLEQQDQGFSVPREENSRAARGLQQR